MTFYILLNINALVNLVWLPLLVIYTYFAAMLLGRKRTKLLGALLGIIPLAWLILMRQFAYFFSDIYEYPVGITLPAICAAAYIWDVLYGEEPERRFSELWFYFIFFPIMIVGPFLTYSRFKSLTAGEGICMSLERMASGINMFAVGFIKRIAVGAVLIEGYSKIFAYSWDSPNLVVIILLLTLIYFGVFFSVSGYYDMATGVSRMFGVDVPEIKANPLKVATVNEYSKTLFGNIREWSDSYVVRPIELSKRKSASRVVRISACCICTVVFLRCEPVTLILCIPLIAFSLASSALRLDKSYKSGRTGVRMLFGMLTVAVIGVFWMFLTMGGGTPSVFDYIVDIGFDNAEYQTDMVLVSFSGIKYVFVLLVALVLLLPRTSWIIKKYENATNRTKAIVDYSAMIILFALFVFTVMFFLPQFAHYNYAPFRYIII